MADLLKLYEEMNVSDYKDASYIGEGVRLKIIDKGVVIYDPNGIIPFVDDEYGELDIEDDLSFEGVAKDLGGHFWLVDTTIDRSDGYSIVDVPAEFDGLSFTTTPAPQSFISGCMGACSGSCMGTCATSCTSCLGTSSGADFIPGYEIAPDNDMETINELAQRIAVGLGITQEEVLEDIANWYPIDEED